MDRLDIHNRQRRLELALKGIKSSSASDKNKEAILSFSEYCFAEGLSVDRVEHYLRMLRKISDMFVKDFTDADKNDIVDLVRKIESRKLSVWTKHDYRVTLRKFFQWLRNSSECPEEVAWIKTNVSQSNCALPEQLLTERDIDQLIRACTEPQMKALVAVLWETGIRVGELLNVRKSYIAFEGARARFLPLEDFSKNVNLKDQSFYLGETGKWRAEQLKAQ